MYYCPNQQLNEQHFSYNPRILSLREVCLGTIYIYLKWDTLWNYSFEVTVEVYGGRFNPGCTTDARRKKWKDKRQTTVRIFRRKWGLVFESVFRSFISPINQDKIPNSDTFLAGTNLIKPLILEILITHLIKKNPVNLNHYNYSVW